MGRTYNWRHVPSFRRAETLLHLTQHTDYALRMLIYLGANAERLVTIAEISERFGLSRSHLMKIANRLVREGFIEGLRGKGGGLRLARPATEISIGATVRVMEQGMALVECFGSNSQCLLTSTCRLKGALGDALEAFLASLDKVTLADLVDLPQREVLRLVKRSA